MLKTTMLCGISKYQDGFTDKASNKRSEGKATNAVSNERGRSPSEWKPDRNEAFTHLPHQPIRYMGAPNIGKFSADLFRTCYVNVVNIVKLDFMVLVYYKYVYGIFYKGTSSNVSTVT